MRWVVPVILIGLALVLVLIVLATVLSLVVR